MQKTLIRKAKKMKKKYLANIKNGLKIYYARAMDNIDNYEIINDDIQTQNAINQKGFSLVNPYESKDVSVVHPGTIIEKNTQLLQDSDVLIANLSIKNYTYIGAIFEIVQAINLKIPTVICVGNTNYRKRLYFHYYCDFICKTISEGLEFIWRFFTYDGIEHQLKEEEAYYQAIATNYEYKSRKIYIDKKSDLDKYEQERIILRKKLKEYCKNKSVLELGCGSGDWTQTIVEVAKAVTCIDVSSCMIAEAKKRLNNSPIQPDYICGDFIDETLTIEPCEIVVSYFALSFLPPIVQNIFLSKIKNWITPGGCILFGESMHISTIPSVGIGCRRIQYRTVGDKKYVMFKEHFSPDRLRKLISTHQLKVFDFSDNFRWFSFCCAQL